MNKLEITYKCPSNIALVKYWGKKAEGIQLPANASISFTLTDLCATTTIQATKTNEILTEAAFIFELDGKLKPSFEPKIASFLRRIWNDYSVLHTHRLYIKSSNNFPHGAGIASSAAGFGALGLCLAHLQQEFSGNAFTDFNAEASRIARLGSGSACRSLYGGLAIWGEIQEILETSDEHATAFTQYHHEFNRWKDCVLLVDEGEKSVSSTQGHAQLDNNMYAQARYQAARLSMQKLLKAMQGNNIPQFINTVESEALQLHAMMMAGPMPYILFKPNTVAIIEKIWEFRSSSLLPLCFTLDAGANVHLLYDGAHEKEILNFVENQLLPYCSKNKYLCSALGGTPTQIK